MIRTIINKLLVICFLCVIYLSLAGCFHVPDKDWLPSKNKIETGTQKDDQVEQALNSFMNGIDVISTQRNDRKNNKDDTTQSLYETDIEAGNGINDDENTNGETE